MDNGFDILNLMIQKGYKLNFFLLSLLQFFAEITISLTISKLFVIVFWLSGQFISAGLDKKLMFWDMHMKNGNTRCTKEVDSNVWSLSLSHFYLIAAVGNMISTYDLRNLSGTVQTKKSPMNYQITCVRSFSDKEGTAFILSLLFDKLCDDNYENASFSILLNSCSGYMIQHISCYFNFLCMTKLITTFFLVMRNIILLMWNANIG